MLEARIQPDSTSLCRVNGTTLGSPEVQELISRMRKVSSSLLLLESLLLPPRHASAAADPVARRPPFENDQRDAGVGARGDGRRLGTRNDDDRPGPRRPLPLA